MSGKLLDTLPNSVCEIESDKEEFPVRYSDHHLELFPEALPLNTELQMNEDENSTDEFIQQISRQMRITFFKEKTKADETDYQANLPILPPDINLNASDNKIVNKTQQLTKKFDHCYAPVLNLQYPYGFLLKKN